MAKRFNVVIPKDDGGIELYPMKDWLRKNPEHCPNDLNPDKVNSHKLRDGLRRNGWRVQETATEVRLVMPGTWSIEQKIDVILGGEEVEVEENLEDDSTSFALEHQLRDFIGNNLSVLTFEGKKLRLYSDPVTGRTGIEFPTDVGFIDILAIDDFGNFYVFELKRARSSDQAIGQLARYMGWLKHNIGKNKGVQGVIVAKAISDNLRFSVSVIPNVGLFEYEISFKLKAVPGINEAV
jgi:hypothetical protein